MSQTVQYNGKLFQRKALAATQMAKDMLDLGDPISRRLATGALSQLGQAEALQHCQDFVAALKDQDRGVRYCAMVYLCFARSFSGPSPVQEYTAEVAELLEDEDPGIRFWAIETLGNQGIASVPQSAQLQRALQDNDPHCRLAAAKAVVRVCPEYMAEAAEILVRAMDPEEDKIFRRSGAEGLGYMGDKALKYLPQLIDALGDCYPPARAAAANSLGELGAEAVLQAASDLARSLDDNDLEVRAAAAKALQRLDITEALLSSEPRLRRWGLEMATEGKEQRHGQALAQLLGDQQDVIRFWAAQALCALGAPACDFPEELNRAVQDSNPDVWPPVLRTIARHMPQALPEALGTMVGHLSDENPARRQRAIQALGAARDDALPFLDQVVPHLEDEDVSVRLATMEALHCAGKRGVRKGDKVLAKLVKTDPDSQVRREALNLLRHYMIAGKFGLDNLF